MYPLSLRALPASMERTDLPVGASRCPAASVLPAAARDALEWAGTSAWAQPPPARRGAGRVLGVFRCSEKLQTAGGTGGGSFGLANSQFTLLRSLSKEEPLCTKVQMGKAVISLTRSSKTWSVRFLLAFCTSMLD